MTKPKTVYLAGPMHGHDDFNREAFAEAAKRLKAKKIKVVNPHDLDDEDDGYHEGVNVEANQVNALARAYYLKRDIPHILDCDGIVMLPGWERSKGATAELVVAMICGLRTFEYRDRVEEALVERTFRPSDHLLVEHWWGLYA